MTASTHILGGILGGITYSYLCGMDTAAAYVVPVIVSGASALIPDIDCPESKLGRKIRIISKPINKLFGHRGLMHAPLFYILIHAILIVMLLGDAGALAIANLSFVGIYSHLILDSFNPGGIPWFYPITKKKYRLAKIYTSSGSEKIVSACMALCISGFAFSFFK